MKVVKSFFWTVLTIVAWYIAISIESFIIGFVLSWLSGAFNISTTFGLIVFYVITLPVVCSFIYYTCIFIGASIPRTKKQATTAGIICTLWQVLGLFLVTKGLLPLMITIAIGTGLGFLLGIAVQNEKEEKKAEE